MKCFTRFLKFLLILVVVLLQSCSSSKIHTITEIGIERTGCFGSCPIYKFLIKDDGSFEYTGDANVDHKGKFAGTVDLRRLHRVYWFIEHLGFLNLKDKYSQPFTDLPTTYTTIVIDGKNKKVEDCGDFGPPNLKAIEQLTDDLMDTAQWKAVK